MVKILHEAGVNSSSIKMMPDCSGSAHELVVQTQNLVFNGLCQDMSSSTIFSF